MFDTEKVNEGGNFFPFSYKTQGQSMKLNDEGLEGLVCIISKNCNYKI